MKHCNFCTIVLAPTRRRGFTSLLRRPFERFPISNQKNFEVLPATGTSYYITREHAQSLTGSKQALWDGPKRIRLIADISKRGIWEKCQSGHAGPMVLQLT